MTKHLTDTLQQRHLVYMGTRAEFGHAQSAPTLNRSEAECTRYYLEVVHKEFAAGISKELKGQGGDESDEETEGRCFSPIVTRSHRPPIF